uniref:C2H2-type domain-containing protein n=1 Tax=Gorilla gorilla gorilla TaxID=9595 RepID=A0A2I2YK51_GORGO
MADSLPWLWEAWLLDFDCEACADSVFTSKIMHAHTTPKHNLMCPLGRVLPTQWGADRSHSAKAC